MIAAIINGIVEGLTEFLPVSSTGHLLIAQALMQAEQSQVFNIAIQMGPILACIWVYRKYLAELLGGWRQKASQDEILKIGVSFGITGFCGLVAKKLGWELPSTVLPVAWAAIVGAGVIFWVERRNAHRHLTEKTTWALPVAVAAGQVLAMIFPGTSRSGAAIMAAMMLGVSRPVAVRFSFLVGIPTLLAAGAKELFDAYKAEQLGQMWSLEVLVAFVVATVTAWISVVWLLKWVQTKDFKPFAWYRIALGVLLLALVKVGYLQ